MNMFVRGEEAGRSPALSRNRRSPEGGESGHLHGDECQTHCRELQGWTRSAVSGAYHPSFASHAKDEAWTAPFADIDGRLSRCCPL
jgi:hypothetical protein